MKLTKDELITLINIVSQVNVPLVSKQAESLRELINKMSKMVDELEVDKKRKK